MSLVSLGSMEKWRSHSPLSLLLFFCFHLSRLDVTTILLQKTGSVCARACPPMCACMHTCVYRVFQSVSRSKEKLSNAVGECLLYTLTGLCSDGQCLLTRTKAWFVPAVLLLDTESASLELPAQKVLQNLPSKNKRRA